MLKKPLAVGIALCLCLCLFAPPLAQAAPLRPRLESGFAMPRLLSLLEVWWNVLIGGEERTGGTTLLEKNGCGIDPNGQPLCGETGGTGTNQDPATSGTGG
jgi:hypothetical protein